MYFLQGDWKQEFCLVGVVYAEVTHMLTAEHWEGNSHEKTQRKSVAGKRENDTEKTLGWQAVTVSGRGWGRHGPQKLSSRSVIYRFTRCPFDQDTDLNDCRLLSQSTPHPCSPGTALSAPAPCLSAFTSSVLSGILSYLLVKYNILSKTWLKYFFLTVFHIDIC